MLIEPRTDLYDRVLNKINQEASLATMKKRLILNLSGLILSVAAFIPLALKLLADSAETGLTQFLALMFSDFSLVMANIGDYFLTVLESTPIVSLAFVLTTLLALVFYTAKLTDSYVNFKKLALN